MRKKPKPDIDTVCQAALCKWGIYAQIYLLFEEMAELQKAVVKHLRYACPDSKWSKDEIAEEIADVEIMLHQMKVSYDIKEQVETIREEKLNRLQKILQGGAQP